ncbi:4-hydroxymandelate synthase [Actinacidiphila rubida]|uniref:4-hydroxymandelate synthase n=1 Tax=Actinacidiphila rubida TaxID=310780 RepID=A0A1H8EIW1_9ACTN|nr:4-hydroxyphenylpyruvate dioxygenase [Actinacidiphila rubida]SEN18807.1 4-hydroxymandelate synthase [Actinacidiphila rubida]
MPSTSAFDDLHVSHTEMYVSDVTAVARQFTDGYGFHVHAEAERTDHGGRSRSLALRQGAVVLVLTQPLDDAHAAAGYLDRHGDGVVDIALRTSDARAAFDGALSRSALPHTAPSEDRGWTTAVLHSGFDDVRHTLVQAPARDGAQPGPLPGFSPVAPGIEARGGTPGLTLLDHVAVSVPVGQLAPSTEYYERVFGFESVYQELMVQDKEAMDSKAVRSPSGELTFTVLAPSPDHDAGHIGDFLERHGSGGVHHLAFATGDIVEATAWMTEGGVAFLSTPDTYYDRLPGRLDHTRHPIAALRDAGILADEDHAGQLYQIFTRTTHPRRTMFFEVVERIGAETFGNGNVRALYEAVQAERDASLQSVL